MSVGNAWSAERLHDKNTCNLQFDTACLSHVTLKIDSSLRIELLPGSCQNKVNFRKVD
jgi:hypothetical protein